MFPPPGNRTSHLRIANLRLFPHGHRSTQAFVVDSFAVNASIISCALYTCLVPYRISFTEAPHVSFSLKIMHYINQYMKTNYPFMDLIK